MPVPRLAVLAAAGALLVLTGLVLPAAEAKAAVAQAASPAAAGCKGVTLAVIPAQGVISNPGQTEGGHLWWQNTAAGICVGTVIEDAEFTATAPVRTLRVIVFDTAEPGGLTVARMQVTAGPGPLSRAFGIHQAFPGLTQVCLAATSPVVSSPDMPCVQVGQPAPPQQQQQFTQSAGSPQAPGGIQPWPFASWGQTPPWWP